MIAFSQKSIRMAAIAGAVVVLDWGTQWLLAPLVGGTTNYGVSFGIASSVPSPILFGSLLGVLLGILWWQRRYFEQFPSASGLFCGGAVANLLERMTFGGGVRDWIFIPGLNLYNNLADWALFIGWSLFLYYTLRRTTDAQPTT